MRVIPTLALACSLATTLSPARADPPAGAAQFQQQCVAADHPLASRAGAEILAKGGNAVDAAVATSFALSVVRPFSCGIGGGGFMVIYLNEHPKMRIASGGLRTCLNYRETAPAAVTPDFYEKLGESDEAKAASVVGGKSVGIPGTVAGLLEALERYGTLDRAAVMAPAIRLAREGFIADAAYVSAAKDSAKKFGKHPGYEKRFAFVWERFLKGGTIQEGARITLPEQADTLEAIARDGRDGFYKGSLASSIVAAVKADGGVITLDDLAGYKPGESAPLTFTFRGQVFLTMPPPSSGGICMAETLGILERTSLDREIAKGYSGAYLHLLIESFKHAFADRSRWLGDPAFVESPVARLLDPANLLQMSGRIAFGRTSGDVALYGTPEPGGRDVAPAKDDGGTSHLCVLDSHGNAVSCTETINLEFGSYLSVGGFCLNDQIDDFTTRRGKANDFGLVQSERNLPASGKRPLSSMSPTIVLSGGKTDPAKGAAPGEARVVAIVGASGGPRIITATTQTLLHYLVFGYDSAKSVGHPRFHHQMTPNVLEFEYAFEDLRSQGLRMIDWMRKQHHQVAMTERHACVQLIAVRKDGTIDAACDPRKGGAPAGR